MRCSNLFLRGIPTEPDVITLTKVFGVPAEGEPIPYDAISEVLHVPVTASRFWTVTSAWRRQLRTTHGLILLARDSQFAVRDPSARLSLSKVKTKQGISNFTEVIEIITGTDRERWTERERSDGDKVQRVASMGQGAALAEAKKRPTPALRAVGQREQASA